MLRSNPIIKITIFTIFLLTLNHDSLFAQPRQYTYDNLNRLQLVNLNSSPVAAYSYDALGNRLTKTVYGRSLKVSPKQLVIAAAAGSQAQFTITSNLNWSISSSQSWLTANISTGSGNATITLTATVNTGSSSRQAIVTIASPGIKPQTVEVTQAGTQNLLNVSPAELTLASASGSTAQFSVSANISWGIVSSESWITLSAASGSNNATITVTANSENPLGTSRIATLTVSGAGVTSKTVAVTQLGNTSVPYFDVTPSNVNLASTANSKGVVSVSSNLSWTVSDIPSWLSCDRTSGVGSLSIELTALTANTSSTARVANINLNANTVNQSFGARVQIIQNPDLDSLYFKKKGISGEQFILFIDYNQDRLTDVLTQVNTTGIIHFYRNTGSTFELDFDLQGNVYSFAAWPSSKLYEKEENFYTDFDNDGNKDLLVYSANHASCTSNSVIIYWGSATSPYFTADRKTSFSISPSNCVGSYAVDFNNDNLTDVFLRSISGNRMFRNDGNRVFSQVSTFSTGRDIGVNFTDYDGDGFQDLVYTKNGWADGQWGIRFNKGLGDGNFSSTTITNYETERPVDDFIQINADPAINSVPDLLFNCSNDASNGARLYWGQWDDINSNFSFITWNTGLPGTLSLINSIDVNFDEYPDLVVSYYTGTSPNQLFTTYVYKNNGRGSFTSSELIYKDKPFATRTIFNSGNDQIKIAAYGNNDSLYVFDLNQFVKSVSDIETISNRTLQDGSIDCFNALQTIIVAGNGTTVDFESGSSATLIAGQSIQFLPGFHSHQGSSMDAYITTNGMFCDGNPAPVAAKAETKSEEQKGETKPDGIEKSIKLYPNPNNGRFTVEIKNFDDAIVSVYNTWGTRVLLLPVNNSNKLPINLPNLSNGIYFIRVTDSKKQLVSKFVVNEK
jgi:YD repeat-containing protein